MDVPISSGEHAVAGPAPSSTALVPADPRPMTSTERWVVLPAFVLAGALVVLLGVRAIRTRRMPLRKQWLHGKKEVTGGVAVGLGVAMSAIGLAMIAGAVAMMVLGRALL